MDSLDYSKEGLEAISIFYNKSISVFVEGKEDRLFWAQLFQEANFDPHIEEVGGKQEINKKIDLIVNHDAMIVVAVDNEYDDFNVDKFSDVRIIHTYGHSIENTMYNSHNIEKTIEKFCKKRLNIKRNITKWQKEFSENFSQLLIYDIANCINEKGVQVLGDCCAKFTVSQNSTTVDDQKIEKFIDTINSNFTSEELNDIEEQLNLCKKHIWYILKGHFLSHGVRQFIKEYVRKDNGKNVLLSDDNLYAHMIDIPLDWMRRIDITTVIIKINKLKEFLA